MLFFKFSQPPCEVCPIIISDEETKGTEKLRCLSGTTEAYSGGARIYSHAINTPEAQSLRKTHEDILFFSPNAPQHQTHVLLTLTCSRHTMILHAGTFAHAAFLSGGPRHPLGDSCSSCISYPVRPFLTPWAELITPSFLCTI